MLDHGVQVPADSTGDTMFCLFLAADYCEATYALVKTETRWHHQQVPHQRKCRGAFDWCLF